MYVLFVEQETELHSFSRSIHAEETLCFLEGYSIYFMRWYLFLLICSYRIEF